MEYNLHHVSKWFEPWFSFSNFSKRENNKTCCFFNGCFMASYVVLQAALHS